MRDAIGAMRGGRFLAALVAMGGSLALPAGAHAATYAMGPSGDYAQFADLPALLPGDVVEVEGGATYESFWFQDPGDPGNPIVIRGIRSGDGRRPILAGGRNTVELSGNHYVFEGFEITGGEARCVYHHADDITIRDCVIHDCPAQGLLGADTDSGSLLLEYTEIYACGEGDRNHQIYMSTDQLTYPGSVFRMQFCWIHDGNGGNGVKSRAERNELYYNWIENSYYHELELIGPDPGGTEVPEDAYREDSDVVGNVFVKGGLNPDHWVVRFGGDGTGQSNGRYRFVHNTVVMAAGTAGVFRLFDGIESLEAHNNVLFQMGAGDPQIVRDSDAAWVGGTRRVAGSNNWILEGDARDIPAEWTGTIRGADPGFESIGGNDLRPAEGSTLADAANPTPSAVPGFDFPSAELAPRFHPPAGVLLAVGTADARPMVGSALDIGAYELGSGPPVMPPDAGPPPDEDAGPTCTPDCGARMCGDDGCGGSCGGCEVPFECGGDGNCTCVAPRVDCAGDCVDRRSDPANCGECGTVCEDDEVCSVSRCSTSCADGLAPCDGACVDLDEDRANCGACGTRCGATEQCVMGDCATPAPMDAGPRDGGIRRDSGSGADGGGGGEDDDGCGCRAIGSRGANGNRGFAWAAIGIAGIAIVIGRRLRRARNGRSGR